MYPMNKLIHLRERDEEHKSIITNFVVDRIHLYWGASILVRDRPNVNNMIEPPFLKIFVE